MRSRFVVALAAGVLGGAQLACTGSFSDAPASEPAARPASPVVAPGGSAAASEETTGGPTSTTLPGPGTEGGPGAELGAEDPAVRLPDEPGERGLPDLPPIEFCDAPTKVLMASCGNGSCHSNENVTIGDFAVDTQRAYNFVDRVSVRHADCGRIIDSRDYSKSLLLTKVNGDFEVPRCGERMPIGSFVITEEQINCLSSWLQQFQM